MEKLFEDMGDVKATLSTLWLFAVLNYLYCDVLTLMDSTVLNELLTGSIEGMQMNQQFLLSASVLMEIPIAMVILSRMLNYKFNRPLNIITGALMTLVQVSSLFMGSGPTGYYLFFSAIEITTTLLVAWTAWKWKPK